MNPRDFKKAAPALGVLIIVAVVLYAITRFFCYRFVLWREDCPGRVRSWSVRVRVRTEGR